MFRQFFFILILFVLPAINVVAQSQYAFRVSYADKKETTYDLSKPNIFLGSKALSRRALQSIAIDSTDLPVVQKYIDSTLKVANGIFHSRSRWQNNCVILVSDTSNINLLRSISFIKNVRYVANFLSPIHFLKTKPVTELDNDSKSNRPLWRTTGGIGYYGDAFDQIKLANGDYLHDNGFRGKGKLIAALDEGFNLVNTLSGFDSLRISGRIVDTYNFNLNTSDVYGYSSHGTQVLSTMAGILNGNYVGTAPNAQYALYVTENSGSEQPFEMDNLVAAMERADSIGADIITISLGYNSFNIGGLDASLSLSDIDGKSTIAAMGANTATKKGILVIASAGNDGATSTWGRILTPGDADSALTCGSVDINKVLAPTSGKGPNASGIMKPDVCMLGAPGVVFNNSGTTSTVGGTSIATPELAGLAACLWESKPSATPYQLRKVIRESAHIASSPNNEMGYGVPNFAKAYSSLSKIITDSFTSSTIICYPNPFTEKINIQIIGNSPNESIKWAILDAIGRTINVGEVIDTANSSPLLELQISNNMPIGTYFLKVKTSKDNRVFTIQKN
jgi:serine protease AprX